MAVGLLDVDFAACEPEAFRRDDVVTRPETEWVCGGDLASS